MISVFPSEVMHTDRLQRNIFRVFLAALVAAGLLFASVPALAADGGGGDYIIKYKESDTPCALTRPTRLRNYTDEDILCTYVLAEYDEAGCCLSVRSWDYTVPALDFVEIAPPDEDSIYGQFVLETATMTPLANARKSLSK